MTFVDAHGTERVVEAVEGQSVMSLAVNNDIAGIDGECGGEMSCGTCHVYVDDSWSSRLACTDADEVDMLEAVDEPRPNSRLGCQVVFEPGLDGLRVTVPGS
ncbi:2Fe-2S iron-sulfur cluster-binding protein [Streptomyces sp. NPDC002346]